MIAESKGIRNANADSVGKDKEEKDKKEDLDGLNSKDLLEVPKE
jgi:hypothetical protein